MDNSEIKYTQKIRMICFIAIMIILTVTLAIMRNPDSDMYWMIETGRFIYKYKAVPYINPWISTKNIPIIVQQPICALLNYIFYCLGGLEHMWIFAICENILLLAVSYQVASRLYANKFPNKEKLAFFIIGELILLNCGMITTRPYIITTLNMVFYVGSLFIYKRNHNFKKQMVYTALITLFQANYQMASLIAIPCFISCFFIGEITRNLYFKEKPNYKSLLKWMLLYIEFGFVSFINPYGINGSLYLFKSQKAIHLLKNVISETKSPRTYSMLGLLILLALISIVYLVKKKLADLPLIYLCLGSVFSTTIALRNAWMLYVYFVFCFIRILPCARNMHWYFHISKLGLKIYRIVLMFLTIAILFAGVFNIQKLNSSQSNMNDLFEIVKKIPDKEKIYTTFNTGGFVEYLGRECYIDARPELYESSITNGKNILQEWYDLEYAGKINIDDFIKEHDFHYFLICKLSNLDVYLKYHDGYVIWENDKYILYKLENNK